MGMVISRAEGEPVPDGVVQALCINYFDLGLQPGFGGKLQHKVAILWEIDARKQNGQRFTVTRDFTASLGERAHLTQFLEGWRGRAFTAAELAGFDLDAIVKKDCILTLVESFNLQGRRFADVSGASRLIKGMYPLKQETPDDYVPEFIKAKIAAAAPGSIAPRSAPRNTVTTPRSPTTPPRPAAGVAEELIDDIPF